MGHGVVGIAHPEPLMRDKPPASLRQHHQDLPGLPWNGHATTVAGQVANAQTGIELSSTGLRQILIFS